MDRATLKGNKMNVQNSFFKAILIATSEMRLPWDADQWRVFHKHFTMDDSELKKNPSGMRDRREGAAMRSILNN